MRKTVTSLTAERLRELLRYDPETGTFTRVSSAGGRLAGSAVGVVNSRGYVKVSADNTAYLAHRLAYLYMTGEWPRGDVDHKDGCGSNNRWSNLRDVTPSENLQNMRRATAASTTGLLGVHKSNTRRHRARITVNGREISLGRFDTPEQAHLAYLAAKRRLHPAGLL